MHKSEYYTSRNFSQTVYTVELSTDNKPVITEARLIDVCKQHAPTTVTLLGIRPKYFVEGSAIYTWNEQGTLTEIVKTFDSEDEASIGLNNLLYYKMVNMSNNPIVYYSYEEAEADFELWVTALNEDDKE